MADEEQRILLVKPGDYVVFGNVGDRVPELLKTVADGLTRELGVKGVVFFANDIDMAKVPADD